METYEEYVEEGKQEASNLRKSQWRLGELAQGVTTVYGQETLKKYAEDIGINYATLRVYKSVVANYENVRPQTNLSWAHHLEAAYQSDRAELLEKAEEKNWSSDDLREYIHVRRGEELGLPFEYQPLLSEGVHEDVRRLTPEVAREAATYAMRDPAPQLSRIEELGQEFADIWTPESARQVMEERYGSHHIEYHIDRIQGLINILTEYREVFQGAIARKVRYGEG